MPSLSIRRPRGDLQIAAALAAGLLLASLLVSTPRAASAKVAAASKTYIVNSTADRPDADVGNRVCGDAAGRCTLRAAIMQANFHAGADKIILPAGTYTLRRPGDDDMAVLGDLDITDSVSIKGAGKGRTIVNGNGSVTQDRVFEVFPSATDTAFSGLVIRKGKKNGTFDAGGGLYWAGGGSRLSLSDVVVEDNRAYDGGGIALGFSTMGDIVDLNRLTIQGNKAKSAVGGASIDLNTGAQFSLRNSRISANKAYEGGGLYLQGANGPDQATSLHIKNTEIDDNTASLSAGFENHSGTVSVPVVFTDDFLHGNTAGNYGGAIGNYGVLDLTATTLAGNAAVSRGAGVYAYPSSSSNLSNVTIAGNVSQGYGGAVYAEVFVGHASTVSLTNVTARGNSASTAGGGIYADPGAVVNMTNMLFAKGSSGANCSAPFGGSSSLSDDGSCGFGAGDGIADLMLGPLSLQGGATETILPKAGSPAIDAGTNSGAPTDDQRGIFRPQGEGFDVGAAEVCPGKPAAPVLVSPRNTTLSQRRVVLDWKDVSCVQGYTVLVRRGSSTGPTLEKRTALVDSTLKTKTLSRGMTYYWRVTAVGDRGKKNSVWRHFHVA